MNEQSDEIRRALDIPAAIEEDGSWTQSYFRGLVRGALRGIFFRWKGRKTALDRYRVSVPGTKKDGSPTKKDGIWYKCANCEILGKAQVSKTNPKGHVRIFLDHVTPVVPLDRYPDWREYIDNLFCSPENLQALCSVCHKEKSISENAQRRANLKTKV
jgi:5-methylcytosine-specific restriction endonuclease McrA